MAHGAPGQSSGRRGYAPPDVLLPRGVLCRTCRLKRPPSDADRTLGRPEIRRALPGHAAITSRASRCDAGDPWVGSRRVQSWRNFARAEKGSSRHRPVIENWPLGPDVELRDSGSSVPPRIRVMYAPSGMSLDNSAARFSRVAAVGGALSARTSSCSIFNLAGIQSQVLS